MKTAMLLALTRPSRSADLFRLDIKTRSFKSNDVVFEPTHLSKQSKSFCPLADFLFPSFPEDPMVCPVEILKAYEDRTASFRSMTSGEFNSTLFLSYVGQHNSVSSSTIARWLKSIMEEAGIDTSVFKAHSVRGATCSTAAVTGVTTKDILDAADWSSEGNFQCFYCRELGRKDGTNFGRSVLSSKSHKSSNITY